MNLRNPELSQANVVDYEPLNECFSCIGDAKAKIVKGGDVDFSVTSPYGLEVLIGEWKTEGAVVPFGQRLQFERMMRRGRTTVIICWHKPGNCNEIVSYRYASTAFDNKEIIWSPVKQGGIEDIKRFMIEWAKTTQEVHPYIRVDSEGW